MDLQHKAILHLDSIKTRMKTSFRFGDEDLSRFEIEGLPGILDNYIQHFNIKTFGIWDTVRNIFSISYAAKLSNSLEEIKNSQNDILYYTQQNSRQLMTYDITTNQTPSLDLETSVQTGFNNSSTCILPDGNIMISGSFVPTHGETYKFNTQTGRWIQLKDLRYPRGLVGLICHDKYLYALGGCTTSQSKKVERMEWSGSGWKHLPDMNSERFYVGMICMNNRIYLIGGAKVSSVEYYDIRTNQFIATNVQVPIGSNMAVVVDDRIYVLSTSRLVVMNREYEVNEIKTLSGMSIDSLNSPRIRGKGELIVEYAIYDQIRY